MEERERERAGERREGARQETSRYTDKRTTKRERTKGGLCGRGGGGVALNTEPWNILWKETLVRRGAQL